LNKCPGPIKNNVSLRFRMNSVKRKIPKSSVLGTVCNRKAKKKKKHLQKKFIVLVLRLGK
jgi:hypothetical protein